MVSTEVGVEVVVIVENITQMGYYSPFLQFRMCSISWLFPAVCVLGSVRQVPPRNWDLIVSSITSSLLFHLSLTLHLNLLAAPSNSNSR